MGEPARSDWARKVHLEVRRRVLRRLARTDANIARALDKMAHRIRRRLRLTGFTDAQVSQVLREEFDRVEQAIFPHIEQAVRDGAAHGNQAAQQVVQQLDRLVGGEGRAGPPRAPGSRPTLTLVPARPSGSGGSSPETG